MRCNRTFAMTIDPPPPAHLRGKLAAHGPITWRRERVEWIARRRAEGWTMDEIAAALGIRQQSVSMIVRTHRLDALVLTDEPSGRGHARLSTLPRARGADRQGARSFRAHGPLPRQRDDWGRSPGYLSRDMARQICREVAA